MLAQGVPSFSERARELVASSDHTVLHKPIGLADLCRAIEDVKTLTVPAG